MPATTIQKKKLIEYEFGSGNPVIHYLGISLANPLANGTGIIEPSSSYGYARVAVVNNKTTWSDYINDAVCNLVIFEFSEVIDNNWNTLEQPLYLFLATSLTGIGNDIKYYTELTGTDKKLIQTGTILNIPVGMFKIIA